MATRTPTVQRSSDGSVQFLFYEGLTNASSDVGSPVPFAEWADRSVQVFGTFGAGGNLRWEGSNKESPAVDADWHALSDPQGNALDIGSAKVEAVTEVTRWARPRVTAGDGTTDLDVYVVLRRQNPMRT